MSNHRTRRIERPAPMFESLEPRLLLSGSQVVTDWDGDQVTITLKGDGVLAVDVSDMAGAHRIKAISAVGAESCVSDLTIAVKKAGGGDGLVNVGRIYSTQANDGLKNLAAPAVNITGDSGMGVNFLGHVASIVLHDVTGGGISAAQNGIQYCSMLKTKITVNDVGANLPIVSSAMLDSLTGHNFGSGSTVTAPGIGKIVATGDFLANIVNQRRDVGTVTVAGAVGGTWSGPQNLGAVKVGYSLSSFTVNFAGAATSFTTAGQGLNQDFNFTSWTSSTLGSLTVKRDMLNGTMSLTQPFNTAKTNLNTVSVGQSITGATIRSAGNIGSVTALAMNAARILAGVLPGVSGPLGNSTAANYFASNATIKSVTVKGLPGSGPQRHSFTGTNIFASHLGPLSILGPYTGNGINNVGAVTLRSLVATKPDGTRFVWGPTNPTVPASWVGAIGIINVLELV